ncbi:DUF4189 domain-containing protein [Luteimonas panaciterrae]|uniref:DUF4189 domain-containing protein n=1 Tax=Luteimonas panaciterrae TaxID=363885 RepID=UPI001CFAF976|nr:DUF4189 domain-containing protein [Luteimonas panaciterrae]
MILRLGKAPLVATIFLLAGLLAMPLVSQAQTNCPRGMKPYRTGSDNDGSGVAVCGPIREQAPEPVQPYWATRWGAIATDGPAGAFGAAEGMSSKRKAKKAAFASCKQTGGQSCKVDLTYSNQCAVTVVGGKTHLSQGAATVEEATDIGLRRCREVDDDCRVYYAACSLPELIR